MSTLAAVRAAVRADVPVLLWGAPGVGKTASLRALAEREGAHLEVLIGSTLDPTDLGYQVPSIGGESLRHVPPAWALRLRAALDRGQPAWLLLDELSCAPPAVQAALLRLVHERQLGDCSLSGCRILAAANPADQGAGAMDLPPAMANRWLHLTWTVDVPAWCRGVLDGWGAGVPSASERHARALVSGFLRTKPGALLACPDDPEKASGAWPSPRSWEALCRALGGLTEASAEVPVAALGEVGSLLAAGLVGEAAGGEWTAWLAQADIPDPELVLSGRAQLPLRADLQHLVLQSVAVVATDSAHPELLSRWDRAWELLASVRQDIRIDAAIVLLDRRPANAPIPALVEDIAAAIEGARHG